MTVAYYEQADLVAQAAVLIEGIVQAHAFVDANKRTAAAAGLVFLRLNGWTLRYIMNPDQDELGQQVLELVTHRLTRTLFIDWLRVHLVPLS